MTWLTRRTAPANARLNDRQAQLASGFILAYLAFAYWLFHYALPGKTSADVNVYVLRPLVWGGLGIVSLLLWQRVSEKPLTDRLFVMLSLLAGAFSVAVMVCSGLIFGFGHSPYARDAFHMAENFWYISTFIFGLEMSRAYLLHVWGKVNTLLAFGLVAVIYAGIWIAPAQYDNLTEQNRMLSTAGRTFLPGVSESIMATFLASLGGPLPAFIYHLSLESFRWLSPILPRLEWTIAAFLGTLVPALAMLIVRDAYFGGAPAAVESEEAEEQPAQKGVSPLILFGGALVVAMIWLNTGMLGVQPFLVSGPSMKPALGPGDVVIIKEVDVGTVKVGDVIRFSRPGGSVIHRVTEVKNSPQGRVFITRGDNNNTDDSPVTAAQYQGKVVLEIPYIGWIPVEIKRLLGN
jgi:signal peptidase